MNVNYTDIAVVVILILCVMKAKGRGITYFAVSTIGKIISLILSVTLYGTISRFLRETPVFSFISGKVAPLVDIEAIPYVAGFSEYMSANDNSEIYKLFRVETFTDYVASYIANIAVNIISVVLVYTIVSAVIKALFRANRVISGLPLIRQINLLTGLLAGLIEGVIIIWLLIIALIFLVLQGKLLNVYDTLLASNIAIYFLRYNIFMAVIFSVTP